MSGRTHSLFVRVEEKSDGRWFAECREAGGFDEPRGVSRTKRSESAAIRQAVQNYIHVRGPLPDGAIPTPPPGPPDPPLPPRHRPVA